MVDDYGNFTSDAGVELAGKAVLSDGSKQIINMLNEQIVFIEDYVHSYPYDWRSKTPVIIKSSHQWFLNVQKFQNQAMASLNILIFCILHCAIFIMKKKKITWRKCLYYLKIHYCTFVLGISCHV